MKSTSSYISIFVGGKNTETVACKIEWDGDTQGQVNSTVFLSKI